MSPELGPTGRFPDGKLCQHDSGEIAVAIGRDLERRFVFIHFGVAIKWTAFSAAAARAMAAELVRRAAEVEEVERRGLQ